jgi:hypothetical protein
MCILRGCVVVLESSMSRNSLIREPIELTRRCCCFQGDTRTGPGQHRVLGDNEAMTDDVPISPRRVAAWPCQSICIWEATGELWDDGRYDDLRVFACRGCGSEWVRTEPWTPIDSGGGVPPEVRSEASRR